MSMNTKSENLRASIAGFVQSKQLVHDYMLLFIAVRAALSQGDGLLWSDINDILKDIVPTSLVEDFIKEN